MQVEVIYALAHEQLIVSLTLQADSTVREAVVRSGLLQRYPEIILDQSPVGIYGERVTYDSLLQDGDRVEIYRPLLVDPMEARRARARSQKENLP